MDLNLCVGVTNRNFTLLEMPPCSDFFLLQLVTYHLEWGWTQNVNGTFTTISSNLIENQVSY